MAKYKYLIVGGGMTADAAVRGIRGVDPDWKIAVVGSDPNPPYNRPPLSKGLWKGKSMDKVWRRTQELPMELFLQRTIQSIDPEGKIALDDQGVTYEYEKLLLATGGTPRRLPFGPAEVIYYRTLGDYDRLREMTEHSDHFGVIGGNFIGSEIAAALSMNGKKVTMFFPEEGIGSRIFTPELSYYINDYYRQKGVKLQAGVSVKDIQKWGNQYVLISDNGGEVEVDGVVAGIGIQPNVELAQKTGLEIGNGIIVDQFLRTSHPDIYAAGDVAEFMSPALGKRMRFEHEDNANSMGAQAGRNMAGSNEAYTHLPYFYSDLFELGYEAVGELDARLETFTDWKDPFKKGVVYYLKEGRVRGVLLWNVWDSVPKARELITAQGQFTPGDLRNRI